MKYEKAKAKVTLFDDFEFMVASAGQIAKIEAALYGNCEGFSGLDSNGGFNCSDVNGVSHQPNATTSITIEGVTFWWKETGNSGKWTCTTF